MSAIIKRELKSYFSSPLGYILLAVLLFFTGIYFSNIFTFGIANMSYVFSPMVTIIFFIIPILTMRLFSEEKKQKTDQILMTSPVRITGIVIGKFIAAVVFFSIYLVILCIFNITLSFFAAPDWSLFFGNIIGMFLFATALISIGLFISSLTESQVVAAVGSFAISFFLMLLDNFATMFNVDWFTKFIQGISFNSRYQAFTQGIFNYSNVLFFLSISAIFLFLTIRILDRKRWA